jgi:hypothetical protein
MRADNSAHLVAAARRRSEDARRRAAAALRRLDAQGQPISFHTLAREAGVSRSWLYSQADLRADVERLRGRRQSRPQQPIPDRQRATDASLQHRLALATERIRQLDEDNRRLRAALAEALGANRLVTERQPRRDTPTRRAISGVADPCSRPASRTMFGTQTTRSQP